MRRLCPIPILLAIMVGCDATRETPAEAGRLSVVASLHPIASLVQEVGGDLVAVRTLLPPGADAHSYDASPRMAEALSGADLVVRVGVLDDWLGDRGRADHLVLTDRITLRGSRCHDHDHGPDHGPDHDPDHDQGHDRGVEPRRDPGAERGELGNPHVWLDPILVRDTILPDIVEALAARAWDAEMEAEFRRRGAAFADSLTALDAELRDLLRDVPTRAFVAAHPAWVYFADRYGLEEIGALHPSPGREVGARELARLVDQVRVRGGAAVIAEPQLGRAGVDALARELGVRVEVADPVGGQGREGREDYLSLMRYNGRAFARALGGSTGQ